MSQKRSGALPESASKKSKLDAAPAPADIAGDIPAHPEERSRVGLDADVQVDLRDKKYKAFVVPANADKTRTKFYAAMADKSDEQKRAAFEREWPLCVIGTDDEAFPFRAKPLLKKPRGDEIGDYVGGLIEGVGVDRLLRRSGYKFIYVNENGKMNDLEYNPDATAFAQYKHDPLVGDVVVVK